MKIILLFVCLVQLYTVMCQHQTGTYNRRACRLWNMWQCNSGQCIRADYRCDQIYDCYDWSDEENCPDTATTCANTEFRCDNGQCIDERYKCDRIYDCSDGSDEKSCPNQNGGSSGGGPCGNGRRMCTSVKKCVPLAAVCDGKDDCGDNSDEQNC